MNKEWEEIVELMNKRPNLTLDEMKNLQHLTDQLAKDVAHAVFEAQIND